MAKAIDRKSGNLDELFQGRIPPKGSPEEWLEREMRALFAGMKGKDGRPPHRQFYEIAEDRCHPVRVLGRRLSEAHRNGVPESQAREVAALLARYIDRKWGRRHQMA